MKCKAFSSIVDTNIAQFLIEQKLFWTNFLTIQGYPVSNLFKTTVC